MISLKNIVLGIAIFILTIFVGIYGISTVFGESPNYDDYCPAIYTEESCVDEGGTWVNSGDFIVSKDGARPVSVADTGYCQYDYTSCQENWEDAQKNYYKKVFLTALPLGIIIIALGAFVFGLESVGSGLMAGGVGIIIYGVGGYWRFTDDWLKFVLSLAGLAIVIVVAYYWNKKYYSKKKR